MDTSSFANKMGGGGPMTDNRRQMSSQTIGNTPVQHQLNSVRISPASSSSSPSSSSADQSTMMLLASFGKQLQQQQQSNNPPKTLQFSNSNVNDRAGQHQPSRPLQHHQLLPTPSSPLSNQQQQQLPQNNNNYRQRALSRRNSANNGVGSLTLPAGPANLQYNNNGPKSAFLSSPSGNQPHMGQMKLANSNNDLHHQQHQQQLQLQQQQNDINNATEKTQRYKTEMCRSFQEHGTCRYGNKCQFAHGSGELRVVVRHPKYKTEMCRAYHSTGFCSYGKRCHFVHEQEEIRADDQPAATLDNKPLSTTESGSTFRQMNGGGGGGSSSNNSSNSNSCSEDVANHNNNSADVLSSSLSRLVNNYASVLHGSAQQQQPHPLSPSQHHSALQQQQQQNRPAAFTFPPQFKLNQNGMISPSPTPSESSSGEAQQHNSNVWQQQPSSSSSSSSNNNNKSSTEIDTDRYIIQEAARSIFDLVHGQTAQQPTQMRSEERPTTLFFASDELYGGHSKPPDSFDYSQNSSSFFQPYQTQQNNNDQLHRPQQQQLNLYLCLQNNNYGALSSTQPAEVSRSSSYSSNKPSPPSFGDTLNQKQQAWNSASGFATSSSSTPLPASASTSTLLQYTNNINGSQPKNSSPPLHNNRAHQQQQPHFAKDHYNVFQRSLSSADTPLSHHNHNFNNNYSDYDYQQNTQQFGAFTTPMATAMRHSNTINDFGSTWGAETSEALLQNNNRRRFASTDHAAQLLSAMNLGSGQQQQQQQQHNDVFAPQPYHNGGGENNAGFFSDIFSTAAAPSMGLAAYASAPAHSDWTLPTSIRYNNIAPQHTHDRATWSNNGEAHQQQQNNSGAVPAGAPWQLGQLLQDIER